MAEAAAASASTQAAQATAAPSCVDTAQTEAAAVRMAKACGREVTVSSKVTETESVVATPDGSMKATQHVVPVRTRKADRWVPIDTGLLRAADGGLVPAATTMQVRFSKGGTDPLVTVTTGNASKVSMSWPTALPPPTVEGDTAVYAEVLSGVDLRLRATASGFTHVLVVKTAAAAANPALAQIRYGWNAQGLTLRTRADGGLDLLNSAGMRVLDAAPGSMWDSTTSTAGTSAFSAGSQAESVSTPVGPGDAAKVAPVQVNVAAGQLTVTPQADMLTSSQTRFPLYIDPPVRATRNRWGYANSGNDNNNDGVARIGKNPECCGGVWRSYFDFNIGVFGPNGVYKAELHTSVTHTSPCAATPFSLWSTGGMDAGVNGTRTGWAPAMGTWLDEKSVEANAGCGDSSPKEVIFSGGLANHVNQALWGCWCSMTLGLATYNKDGYGEGVDYWKKVDPSQVWLTGWYNHRPETPTVQPFDGSVCPTSCASSATTSSWGGYTHGWWKLDETSGTSAGDSSGKGRHGTASGGLGWSDGAATFNGSNAQIATGGNVVDANLSYSVSAWVKSGDLTKPLAFVSQDANYISSFVLDHTEWATTGGGDPIATDGTPVSFR